MTAIKPIGTELKVRQMNGLNSKANYYGVGIQFCESGGYPLIQGVSTHKRPDLP